MVQQDSLLQELTNCTTTTTRQNSDCIHTLQKRSEAHERLHTETESRITKLEREIADMRSRPSSPYTPRDGSMTPRGQGSTTASSAGGRPIDDFQLVIGGLLMPVELNSKPKFDNSSKDIVARSFSRRFMYPIFVRTSLVLG